MAAPLVSDSNAPHTKEELYWKIIHTLTSIFIFITMSATMWSMSQISDVTKEVAAMKASRFTITDGVNMATAMSDLQTKYADIMVNLMQRVEVIDERTRENPPQWVLDDVKELSLDTKVQRDQLAALSARIASIEARLRASQQ